MAAVGGSGGAGFGPAYQSTAPGHVAPIGPLEIRRTLPDAPQALSEEVTHRWLRLWDGEDMENGEAEDEDEEHEGDEPEGAAFLLEDADSVDEDAIPRQKVEIDNKVGSRYFR